MAPARRSADNPWRRRADPAAGGQIVRAAAFVAALAIGVAADVVAAAARSHPAARAAAGSALQVTEVEYRLLLSRGVVKAGPVDLEMIDGGMDPHDLRLRHGSARSVTSEPELNAGQRWDGVVDLTPGVYHLWCSLPGHWKLGMHATLHVVR
ncbi:MAG: hypothetical protein ACRDLP_08300 [Solirubrobacteraceae bacterium]